MLAKRNLMCICHMSAYSINGYFLLFPFLNISFLNTSCKYHSSDFIPLPYLLLTYSEMQGGILTQNKSVNWVAYIPQIPTEVTQIKWVDQKQYLGLLIRSYCSDNEDTAR